MESYKTETITQHGITYHVEWFYDHDMGAPWENSDGHGIVSEWTRCNKKPGELILNEDWGQYRYYDFAATMKKAKAEGWNCARNGKEIEDAVMADFKYLQRWCNDQWHYCGIIVTLLDDYGEETDISASLWGIESDQDGYHASVIQDLIGECEYTENRRVYPVTHCGV